MKILLTAVNAKYIHSNPAIYSLAAYAGSYREHVQLAEYTINHSIEFILMDIFKQRPDVLALSCYIWNDLQIREIAGEIHKILPETEVWLGGPQVSFDAADILRERSGVRGIMRGEGEGVFLDLAGYYIDGTKALADINGITYRDNTGVIRENPGRECLDLSGLPFPYQNLEDFENRIIYYESSRGCPFSCSYCLSGIDRQLRFRDPELVKKELAFFLDHQVKQVKFIDRTFNCSKKHAMEIWRFLKEQDNGITNFHFEIAADLLDDDAIALFADMRPGLIQLEIGVQSTNEKTIREIDRKTDLAKLKSSVRRVKQGKNIHQHLDLIAGLPFEDYRSFQHSFNEVYDLEPDQLQLGFLKTLKGSVMHSKKQEYGLQCREMPPYEVLVTNWISYSELLKLKMVEQVLELYYNSGQFAHTLAALVQIFDTPFQMYQELAGFYEANGYHKASHNRLRVYEILLEFIDACRKDYVPCFCELLTYDLYLRENVINRPAFTRNLSPYKERIKTIIRRQIGENYRNTGKLRHVEVFHFQVDKPVLEYILDEKEIFIMFDYQNRDPLTHNAKADRLGGSI